MRYSLSEIGIIQVRGSQAATFLQGQVTCDVQCISNGSGTLAAHCNPQGRVISLFHLGRLNDAYYLIMPATMVELTIKTLSRYALFFNVKLDEVTGEWFITGHQGAENTETHSLCIPLAKDSDRQICVDPAHVQPNPDTASAAKWHALNIIEKVPAIYPATSGKLLPQELDLDSLGAISFEKGCYTGQEIIARIHYRGKVKNQLHAASINSQTCPKAGDPVYSMINEASRDCGIVIDACLTDTGTSTALIVISESDTNEKLKAGNKHSVELTLTGTGLT